MPARAEMIGTPQLLAADARQATVSQFLARGDVQRELEALGVSPVDAATRVAGLTEGELRVLSSRIDSLPAGGHLSTLEVLLIVLLLVVLLA